MVDVQVAQGRHHVLEVRASGAHLEGLGIDVDHFFKALAVAAGKGGDAAAGLTFGHPDTDAVVAQHLDHGLGHMGVDLVHHAARIKGHGDAGSARGFVERGHFLVKGFAGELGKMAVRDDRHLKTRA